MHGDGRQNGQTVAIECEAFLDAERVCFGCNLQLQFRFCTSVVHQGSDPMRRAGQNDGEFRQILEGKGFATFDLEMGRPDDPEWLLNQGLALNFWRSFCAVEQGRINFAAFKPA